LNPEPKSGKPGVLRGKAQKRLERAARVLIFLRAWVEGNAIWLLVAYYNNPGAERFFRSHAAAEDRPLKPGDVVEDTIFIEWCD
jgi:hypothetical protein